MYPPQLTVCLEACLVVGEGLGEVIRWVSCILLPVDYNNIWMGKGNDTSVSQQSLTYLRQQKGRGGGGGRGALLVL